MAIQTEIWQAFIAENLYEDNPHLNLAVVADEYVEGHTVHIPSAGTAATITRNRSTYPALVHERTDAEATYDIDEFTIDPVRVPNADLHELSYDKMASLLNDVMLSLRETVGDWMFYYWRSTVATYQTRTSGTSVSAHAPGATGTRKRLLAEDIQTAARIMNYYKVPTANRYVALDAFMYDQLLSDLRFGEFRDTVKEMDLARGVIGQLFGFNIIMRPTVLFYDNTGTPVPREPGYAGAAADNAAALCWQTNLVERAFGAIDVFEDVNNPLYYGTIVSGLVRSGGRKRRYDGNGVVAIIQSA
jgi:hypothetical protein